MKRIRINTNKKVDAILTADWHLQEKDPICRLDNFKDETQWRKVDFISDLQKMFSCAVFHAGDLFDHWKPSPELLSIAAQHLPDNFISVYGNHDLPQHSLELSHKCGLYNMMVNGKAVIPASGNYGQPLKKGMQNFWVMGNPARKIAMQHIMTYQGKEPWPGCTDPKAAKLLRQFPDIDLIITGDNHQSFVEQYKGRLLVNPGSIFRMDADQINFEPRVYLWHSEDNTVTPIYIPIEKDVISREHLKLASDKKNRIDAFISALNTDWDVTLSFEENLMLFEKSNKVHPKVMKIVYSTLS